MGEGAFDPCIPNAGYQYGNPLLETKKDNNYESGNILLQKGQYYPIRVVYGIQSGRARLHFHIKGPNGMGAISNSNIMYFDLQSINDKSCKIITARDEPLFTSTAPLEEASIIKEASFATITKTADKFITTYVEEQPYRYASSPTIQPIAPFNYGTEENVPPAIDCNGGIITNNLNSGLHAKIYRADRYMFPDSFDFSTDLTQYKLVDEVDQLTTMTYSYIFGTAFLHFLNGWNGNYIADLTGFFYADISGQYTFEMINSNNAVQLSMGKPFACCGSQETPEATLTMNTWKFSSYATQSVYLEGGNYYPLRIIIINDSLLPSFNMYVSYDYMPIDNSEHLCAPKNANDQLCPTVTTGSQTETPSSVSPSISFTGSTTISTLLAKPTPDNVSNTISPKSDAPLSSFSVSSIQTSNLGVITSSLSLPVPDISILTTRSTSRTILSDKGGAVCLSCAAVATTSSIHSSKVKYATAATLQLSSQSSDYLTIGSAALSMQELTLDNTFLKSSFTEMPPDATSQITSKNIAFMSLVSLRVSTVSQTATHSNVSSVSMGLSTLKSAENTTLLIISSGFIPTSRFDTTTETLVPNISLASSFPALPHIPATPKPNVSKATVIVSSISDCSPIISGETLSSCTFTTPSEQLKHTSFTYKYSLTSTIDFGSISKRIESSSVASGYRGSPTNSKKNTMTSFESQSNSNFAKPFMHDSILSTAESQNFHSTRISSIVQNGTSCIDTISIATTTPSISTLSPVISELRPSVAKSRSATIQSSTVSSGDTVYSDSFNPVSRFGSTSIASTVFPLVPGSTALFSSTTKAVSVVTTANPRRVIQSSSSKQLGLSLGLSTIFSVAADISISHSSFTFSTVSGVYTEQITPSRSKIARSTTLKTLTMSSVALPITSTEKLSKSITATISASAKSSIMDAAFISTLSNSLKLVASIVSEVSSRNDPTKSTSKPGISLPSSSSYVNSGGFSLLVSSVVPSTKFSTDTAHSASSTSFNSDSSTKTIISRDVAATVVVSSKLTVAESPTNTSTESLPRFIASSVLEYVSSQSFSASDWNTLTSTRTTSATIRSVLSSFRLRPSQPISSLTPISGGEIRSPNLSTRSSETIINRSVLPRSSFIPSLAPEFTVFTPSYATPSIPFSSKLTESSNSGEFFLVPTSIPQSKEKSTAEVSRGKTNIDSYSHITTTSPSMLSRRTSKVQSRWNSSGNMYTESGTFSSQKMTSLVSITVVSTTGFSSVRTTVSRALSSSKLLAPASAPGSFAPHTSASFDQKSSIETLSGLSPNSRNTFVSWDQSKIPLSVQFTIARYDSTYPTSVALEPPFVTLSWNGSRSVLGSSAVFAFSALPTHTVITGMPFSATSIKSPKATQYPVSTETQAISSTESSTKHLSVSTSVFTYGEADSASVKHSVTISSQLGITNGELTVRALSYRSKQLITSDSSAPIKPKISSQLDTQSTKLISTRIHESMYTRGSSVDTSNSILSASTGTGALVLSHIASNPLSDVPRIVRSSVTKVSLSNPTTFDYSLSSMRTVATKPSPTSLTSKSSLSGMEDRSSLDVPKKSITTRLVNSATSSSFASTSIAGEAVTINAGSGASASPIVTVFIKISDVLLTSTKVAKSSLVYTRALTRTSDVVVPTVFMELSSIMVTNRNTLVLSKTSDITHTSLVSQQYVIASTLLATVTSSRETILTDVITSLASVPLTILSDVTTPTTIFNKAITVTTRYDTLTFLYRNMTLTSTRVEATAKTELSASMSYAILPIDVTLNSVSTNYELSTFTSTKVDTFVRSSTSYGTETLIHSILATIHEVSIITVTSETANVIYVTSTDSLLSTSLSQAVSSFVITSVEPVANTMVYSSLSEEILTAVKSVSSPTSNTETITTSASAIFGQETSFPKSVMDSSTPLVSFFITTVTVPRNTNAIAYTKSTKEAANTTIPSDASENSRFQSLSNTQAVSFSINPRTTPLAHPSIAPALVVISNIASLVKLTSSDISLTFSRIPSSLAASMTESTLQSSLKNAVSRTFSGSVNPTDVDTSFGLPPLTTISQGQLDFPATTKGNILDEVMSTSPLSTQHGASVSAESKMTDNLDALTFATAEHLVGKTQTPTASTGTSLTDTDSSAMRNLDSTGMNRTTNVSQLDLFATGGISGSPLITTADLPTHASSGASSSTSSSSSGNKKSTSRVDFSIPLASNTSIMVESTSSTFATVLAESSYEGSAATAGSYFRPAIAAVLLFFLPL